MVTSGQPVLFYIFIYTLLSISNKVGVVVAVFFNYLCLQVTSLCRLAPPSSEASEDKTNFHLF